VHPHVNALNYVSAREGNFNVVDAPDHYVLFLDKPGFWPDIDLKKVTTLVLSNNFKLGPADLEKLTGLKKVVADASNNPWAVSAAEKLSCNFGIAFYNTRSKGAYLLTL
jgi:hypothetical protein